jgi:small subunit ribosomal protein S8
MNATGDPITDLLNRLRNGMRAGHDRVDVPASRVKENLVKVLAEEGYVASYRRVEEKGRPLLRIGLKYDSEGEPIVNGLERVSRPGRRVYAAAKEIPEVLGGLGVSILSTSRGIVTGQKAREQKLGGEILCNVW